MTFIFIKRAVLLTSFLVALTLWGFSSVAMATCQWNTTTQCSADSDDKGAGCDIDRDCYCGDYYYTTSTEKRRRCRQPAWVCPNCCQYLLYDEITQYYDSGAGRQCECTVDGQAQACYTGPAGTMGTGICAAGYKLCSHGYWGSCLIQITPGTEICDGQDNNCDGRIDEGCNCVVGSSRACYDGPAGTSGVGECHSGTQTCGSSDNGSWGSCDGEMLPQPETCDGKDNNCNDVKDENQGPCCGDPSCGDQCHDKGGSDKSGDSSSYSSSE